MSSTDEFWDERARTHADPERVNIEDVHQRDLELDFVLAQLKPDMRVLEVGCGSGYATAVIRDRVQYVDSFDFSPSMVELAKRAVGETNNRFFRDDVLRPGSISQPYDTIVCIRVLINLRSLEEQRAALSNLTAGVAPGAMLVLVEGFADGFAELSKVRVRAGLPALIPARINHYVAESELMQDVFTGFDVVDTFDTGVMDVLTRVALPAIIGADAASSVTEHHAALERVARAISSDGLRRYARVRGWALRRRDRA